MRFKGSDVLRAVSATSEPDWTAQDLEQIQTANRKRVLENLVAEVTRLSTLSEQYQKLESLKANASPGDVENLSRQQAAFFEEHTESWRHFVEELSDEYADMFATVKGLAMQKHSLIEDLEDLNFDFEGDQKVWKQKLAKIPAKAQKRANEAAQAHRASTAALRDTESLRKKLLSEGPLFSKCVDQFIQHKRKQLMRNGIESKEVKSLQHKIKAFLEIIGDKPIASYNFADLSQFTLDLSYLPEYHNVDPRFANTSMKQAIELNRRYQKKFPTLSKKTINTNYVGKIKTALRWLCSIHRVAYPYEYIRDYMPRDVRDSLVREGLPANRLNDL